MPDGLAAGVQSLRAFVPLLRDLVFLKRVRSAGRPGSLAQRLFLRAWASLAHGEDGARVMQQTVGAALAALRLGDLDAGVMRGLGIDPVPVLHDAMAAFAPAMDAELLRGLTARLDDVPVTGEPPAFTQALAEQPRAGVTCPGLPRIGFAYIENHAEHCLCVAVGGAVLAAGYGANASDVFLAGLAHHFHNAFMPDSGYAGEVLLGGQLDTAIARAQARARSELSAALAERCRCMLEEIETDRTASARAFHAADVLDRVLETEANLAFSRLSMDDVLGRYALVHAGPIKRFHDDVLRGAGLAC